VINKKLVDTGQLLIEPLPRGDERILLVDEEPVIVRMLERVLDILGYRVTVFSSSMEALASYTKNPDKFDLVITDMTMPEMSGIDLTRALLTLRPELPIILCTGFSEAINEAQAKSFGIRDYIKKPVDTLRLARAIRKALTPP